MPQIYDALSEGYPSPSSVKSCIVVFGPPAFDPGIGESILKESTQEIRTTKWRPMVMKKEKVVAQVRGVREDLAT